MLALFTSVSKKIVVLLKYSQIKFFFVYLYFSDMRVKRGWGLYPALIIGDQETYRLATNIYSGVEDDHAALFVEINNYC